MSLRSGRSLLALVLAVAATAALWPAAADAGRWTITTSRGGWCDLDNWIGQRPGILFRNIDYGMVVRCYNLTKFGQWEGHSYLKEQANQRTVDELVQPWSNFGAGAGKTYSLGVSGTPYDLYTDFTVGLVQTKPVESFHPDGKCFIDPTVPYDGQITCIAIYDHVN
jgi:hypothetical protein